MTVRLLPTDVLPGQRIVYHVGYLVRDRENEAEALDAQLWAQRLYLQNRVMLVQEKIADMVYKYVAIGRKLYR